MNKILNFIGAIFLFLIASCSSDISYQQEPEQATSTIDKVLISAKDFEFDTQSRTTFNITNSGAEFLWSENDTVGIYPGQGTQVEFPMTQGAGTKSAAFDGGGWGLKKDHTYYAYYPFSRKNYMSDNAKSHIYITYEGQTQNGNGDLAHLGAYDYMAAAGARPENGDLNFQFEHLGALVQLTIPVDNPTALETIELVTENEDFTTEGYLDITASNPSITPKSKSNTLLIGLHNVETQTDNEDVVIYFMIAPTDLSSSTLSMTIIYMSGATHTVSLDSKNFLPGHAYALKSPNIPSDPYNGHKYVDLGLPSGIKWSTCNIGANEPMECGDYFAWGETEPKSSYTTSNYKWSESFLSNGVLSSQFDAATVNWGDKWRMPTTDEFYELKNKCTWTWTTNENQSGYLVTGPNGNSIFLPAAGIQYGDNGRWEGKDQKAWYWTTEYYGLEYNTKKARVLFFNSLSPDLAYTSCSQGLPIRPVAD